jgi:uncharacterized protein (DUF433 family)
MTESEIVRDFRDLEIADIRATLAYAAERERTTTRVTAFGPGRCR